MTGVDSAPAIVAFAAARERTGRTSVLCNLAVLLAAAGKRVVILDWCADGPRTAEYLRPFRVRLRPVADLLGPGPAEALAPAIVTKRLGRGDDLSGVVAGLAGTEYTLPLGLGEFVGITLAESAPAHVYQLGGSVFDLRTTLREIDVDYVLIDGPEDLGDLACARLAELCDVVALCFPPTASDTDNMLAAIDVIAERTPGRTEVVAILTGPDDSVGRSGRARPAAAAFRAAIDRIAGQYRADDNQRTPVHPVGMTFRHYDTYEPALALLIEQPGQPSGPLADYAVLATAVTGGDVAAVPAIPSIVRSRYRRSCGIDPAEPSERFVIRYRVPDRPWADWIRGQLGRAGAAASLVADLGGAAAVPFGLPVLAVGDVDVPTVGASDVARLRIDSARPSRRTGPTGTARPTEPTRPTGTDGQERDQPTIDLTDPDPQTAAASLLIGVGLIPPGLDASPAQRPRLPGLSGRSRHEAYSAPPRNTLFVARETSLEQLRDQLTGGRGGQTVILSGGAGVGKSEIAKEYAHRFAYDYDVVWWVPAQDQQTIRASLAGLAGRIAAGGTSDGAAAALEALAARKPARRWLLVYDNADGHGTLAGLLPAADTGHVIVTTREAEAPSALEQSLGRASLLEILEFGGNESVRLLTENVPDIPLESAAAVADAVDHLPLALRMAIAWLRESLAVPLRQGLTRAEAAAWCAAEFLARLRQLPPHLVDEPIPGSHTAGVARVLALLLDTMSTDANGRMALLLAEMCAHLSPEGAALTLLRSSPMINELAAAGGADGAQLIADSAEFDSVVWTGARFGLFDVDWGRPGQVRMHRATQLLLRSRLKPGDASRIRRHVLTGLARCAPTDPELGETQHRPLLDELQRHLEPSGAIESEDQHVRHWITKQVRYLYRTHDGGIWRLALPEYAALHRAWAGRFGADDELTMRLAVQVANLHRALGQNAQALELDEQVLRHRRRTQGLAHLRVLISGRNVGGDLRGSGRFDEALAEDQNTWAGFRALLGADHPDTAMAAHNLALSTHLSGDSYGALARERDVLRRYRRLFGDEALVWSSVCNIGVFLCEVGNYAEALSLLRDALARVQETRPTDHVDELMIRRVMAVAERRAGDLPTAREHNVETLAGYRRTLGENHPFTRACRLSGAMDYHLTPEPLQAVREAGACLRGYEQTLGGAHPFTSACLVNLGFFQRGAGESGQAISRGERGMVQLTRSLGRTHPWTLAAAVNQAGNLAATDRVDAATELLDGTIARCRTALLDTHRITRAAVANRARLAEPGSDARGWHDLDIDIPQT